MASPFQQQVRQRKFLYIGLIVVLFTVSLGWRRSVIDGLAERLAIREQFRGEVELTGAVVRLGLTGSRGLATCILWNNAMDKQKKNQWNELEVIVRSLTKLQPHFITPWLFQSWNLAYNVSVESDRVRDKYFYITRGVELLAEGERQNANHPDLRWSIGFYVQHKVGQSDENNYQRSLFQLSLIPPNERDPARFWKPAEEGPEFNWVEFEQFCRQHPQLIRRLKVGMHRDTLREKKRLFTCEKPEDVVQFLQDNYHVPSLYKVTPLPAGVPAQSRIWDPSRKDELLAPAVRFPILPPPHADPFDREALVSDSTTSDATDAFTVSHAWFCYAQEPLPAPSAVLPGNSEPIVDRARQRRPRNLTTLIFRNYPAQGCRYMAERLQQEGWYDGDAWDVSDWFQESKLPREAGKEFRFGGGKPWSLEAWRRAAQAWKDHGEKNLLLFPSQADEQNMKERAERFARRHRISPLASPPELREEDMTQEEREEYRAAKYMFEWSFYRRVSNFPHHYNRTLVEQQPVTVMCKKMFFLADQADLSGSPLTALNLYRSPPKPKPPIDDWQEGMSPLDAWKDLVLMKNKEYRRDTNTQELSAEYQLRYLRLYNRFDGRELKEQLAKLALVLPLVPKSDPEELRPPIVKGPFEVSDSEGVALIDEAHMDIAMDRLGLQTRRKAQAPPPTTMMAPPDTIETPGAPAKKP